MPAEKKLNRFLLPVIAFAVTFTIGLGFTGLSQSNRNNASRLNRQQLLTEIRSEIEHRLAVTLTATEMLAHEVVRSQGRVQNFNDLAQGILDQIDGISNLQLAPAGVVRRIHPLASNVEALGHAILGDERRNASAFAAVESGKLTLAGPINLVQGGIAVIARKPVYLWPDAARAVKTGNKAERPPFWGFVSAMIMLDELLDSASLTSLADKGYAYQFSRTEPGKNNIIDFAENGVMHDAWSDSTDILIPNGKWILSIGNSRAAGAYSTAIELAFTLLISVFLAIRMRFYLTRQPVQ